jgi:GT2 family glycosyltransferase
MASHINPDVSVVIPCHSQRRWPQLIAAVESVLRQRPCPAEVVIVVDRNDELLERARIRWPGATVLANALQAGVSGNRNTGIRHTRTPLVALLDDDACARPGWLAAMTAPLSDPTVIGTGSTILPAWESTRPSWFPDELLWTVVSTSSAETDCATVRNVWSASMALRRSVFESVGGFRLGFGKHGNRSRPEDTDLCLRMSRASSGRWVHVPSATVDHMIPKDRMSVRAVLTRCYHEGRGKIELARLIDDRDAFGIERDFMRKTVPFGLVREFARMARGRGLVHGARGVILMSGAGAAVVGAAIEMLSPRHVYANGLVAGEQVPSTEVKVPIQVGTQLATAPAAAYPAAVTMAGTAKSIESSTAHRG